jgi:fructose-1,6-bisphosphatase/inositol monophosphatase family enzyme
MEATLDERARQEYLDFALDLIPRTRAAIRSRLGRLTVEVKPDASLVTDVDKAVEALLREVIAARFPAHGILGEEFGHTQPEAAFQWILDPIDGTDNLAHDIPTYGTIIALHHEGTPLVGVIDHPALDLTYCATRGLGAFRNGQCLSIAPPDPLAPLAREIVATTAPENFARSQDLPIFDAICRAFPNMRIYRDCFAQTRAAQGSVGAMVEFNVKLWDIAAVPVLVEEAGGKYVRVRERDGVYSAVFGKPAVVDALLPILGA